MSDDTSLTARLRDTLARLAPTQDGDVSPQARDERPITVGREEHTQEPDRDDIQRWRDEYYENPLIRNPVRNFAADVVEPGYRVLVDPGEDAEEPSVPAEYPMADYRGLELSAALEKWLSSAAIVGGRFDRDFSDLLEDVVIDLRGRRGTALIEHAYDDPREREFILGLRAFKAETTTAYTREGKRILLRPDDTEIDFETSSTRWTRRHPSGSTSRTIRSNSTSSTATSRVTSITSNNRSNTSSRRCRHRCIASGSPGTSTGMSPTFNRTIIERR